MALGNGRVCQEHPHRQGERLPYHLLPLTDIEKTLKNRLYHRVLFACTPRHYGLESGGISYECAVEVHRTRHRPLISRLADTGRLLRGTDNHSRSRCFPRYGGSYAIASSSCAPSLLEELR